MNNALDISGLSKNYSGFTLDNITFAVPNGSIVGLIGENGAGKSTTINAILGLIQEDSGQISILGKEELGERDKEQIGVVFDGSNFPEILSPKKINRIMKNIYRNWDERCFFRSVSRFSLPLEKPIKQFSKGMKMKLAISPAMSHHSKLLILDEATSGLDPIIRDDILDTLLDFVQESDNSVLLSSHITSDLEKVADHIVFIHEGKVVFFDSKEALLSKYGLIECEPDQYEKMDAAEIVRYRKTQGKYQILISDRLSIQRKYPDLSVAPVTIDEIMLFYVKGEEK